jgi:signal transduction histidine kinase
LIWSVSMDSKLIAANNAFLHSMKELTGVEPKPGDDFSRTERIGSDTFNVWSTLYATAFTGKSFKPEVYTPPTTEHAESWIEASFSPIVVNDVMVGIACFSRDITQRKLAELERAKMTDDLIQRNRDLEQFTFIISHNLRAPSANIIGLTQFLQSGTLSAEEQIRCLDGLATSAANLDAVIKDINTILQVKREIKEKKEFISFSTLVNDILVSLGNVYDKKRIHLTTDFAEVDEIFSLKAYLHSVFYNLISNSIKYSKPHEQASIEIKSKKEKGNVILTFKDNGLGIDLNTKGDKVFGLYRRFHSHVEGKGMGLFMVKTQVEAIGGKISVASEVNNGTEFTITLQNLIDNSNDYDTKTIYPRG